MIIRRSPLTLFLVFTVFSIINSSCNSQPTATDDLQATIDAAVAGTVYAFLGTKQASTHTPAPTQIPTTAAPSFTPTFTPNTSTPTYTPSPTSTLTPTATNSSLISAEVNTNCREGPSTAYRVVGYLLVGDIVEVHGHNASETWWYIQNPTTAGQYCWVWAETTAVTGEVNNLPEVTPPPPPTKKASTSCGFSIKSVKIHNCGGVPVAFFKVYNHSTIALESGGLTITDLTNGKHVFGPSSSNAPFLSSDQCNTSYIDRLGAGKSLYMAGSLGKNVKPGHVLNAIIRLCTKEGLNGYCSQRTTKFSLNK
jgi:hypothetical protein